MAVMTPVETTKVVIQAPAVKSETVKPEPITKVSIVISKGSLDGIYPGQQRSRRGYRG